MRWADCGFMKGRGSGERGGCVGGGRRLEGGGCRSLWRPWRRARGERRGACPGLESARGAAIGAVSAGVAVRGGFIGSTDKERGAHWRRSSAVEELMCVRRWAMIGGGAESGDVR